MAVKIFMFLLFFVVNLNNILFVLAEVEEENLNDEIYEPNETSNVFINDQDPPMGCHCYNYSCGCCEYVGIIRGNVCSTFSYLPNDYGISVTITYNNHTLFNETISARNPPPLCVGIPEIEKISAEVCLRFYDLTCTDKHFHGCVNLKVIVYHIIHKKIEFGCFNIPPLHRKTIMAATSLPTDDEFRPQVIKI